VYLASGAYELQVKRRPPTALRLLALAVASLGFVGLALLHTHSTDWTARALILAAVGVVNFGLGAALLKDKARRPATVMLGQALALFAGAVACFFSGFTITLVWAGLAAVVAYLAADADDRWWLAGAWGLFAAALLRLVEFDLPEPSRLQELYLATSGAQGALREGLLNPTAYALFGCAVALLASARFSSRSLEGLFRTTTAVFLTLGHLLLLVLVTREVLYLALDTPTPPPGLSGYEFAMFARDFRAQVASQAQGLSMLTTIVVACYAAVLVGIGFGFKEKAHRYLGLGLFAFGLLKLGAWDVWHLQKLYKMAVLIGFGVLLLASSFLYARFGRRLVVLLREGAVDKAVLVWATVLCGLWAGHARAFDATASPERRPVEGVSTPGYYRAEVDPELYRHAEGDGLSDVRLADPTGAEVPWLIRDVPVAVPVRHHDTTLVDPVLLPQGAARAVFDLGKTGLKHDEIVLSIAGLNFVRKTRVEVSNDEKQFDLLQEGSLVYSVASADSRAAATTLRYPTSDARYLRVTVLSGPDGQALRITGGEVAYWEASSTPLVRSFPVALEPSVPLPDGKAPPFVFDFGAPGVPVSALSLDIATPTFERNAQMSASTSRAYWTPVGCGLLYRAGSFENLRLSLGAEKRRFVKVDVTNGDDRPLEVKGARAEYRAQELVFRADAPGEYALYLGDRSLKAPRYDLAGVLARSGTVSVQAAHFGVFTANPSFGKGEKPKAPAPLSEQYTWVLSGLFIAALVGLGGWTFRLMQKANKP